jgi:hypothetical protein
MYGVRSTMYEMFFGGNSLMTFVHRISYTVHVYSTQNLKLKTFIWTN